MTRQKLIDLLCKTTEIAQPFMTVIAAKYAWAVAAINKLLEVYKEWLEKGKQK